MPPKAKAKAKAMPTKAEKPKVETTRPKPVKRVKESNQPDRRMFQKLAVIGKTNVERHAGFESKQLLRRQIAHHQVNHQHQMEHDRLLQARVQGPLQAHAESRLSALKNMIK